ncbi:U-box domain-containing protein [Salinisphaera sp. G21_0]|uniref:U-box domain-containing protein n=1 Tax=Salinisphaera sp. G21_0 TaxID=2821094 RepID=UPI001ADA9B8D|nr:U-box domain-containing protein [Salinisphaera sp. G21_0]MBO9480417.1 hypothetical protein [Salinisphaera sp. G21_0]
MEASNYSIHNNRVKFPESFEKERNEETEQSGMSLNRKITVCHENGAFISSAGLPNSPEPEQKKFLTTTHIQPAISSSQFKVELEEIKAWLDDGCLNSVEDCKAQLKSIIEDDVGVYRYKKNQNILLHIEENERVKAVKNTFDNIVSHISHLVSINYFNDSLKPELILLVCKHYKCDNIVSIVEKLVSDFDKNDEGFCDILLNSLEEYECFLEEKLPVYLAFDLLLDGQFSIDSGLNFVLFEKLSRNIGVDFPPSKLKMNFEFDNNMNVQMIWALFSILNYWDTCYISFLNSFTEAVYDQQGIDLHKDEDLIKYIAMRMDTTGYQKLRKLLAMPEDSCSLLNEIEITECTKVCEHMMFPEKLIFILKSFSRSDYFKGKADGLFDYLNRTLPTYHKDSSDFVMLLQKSPVRALSEVEECMDKVDKKLKKMADESFLELKKQKLSEILEIIEEQRGKEVISLTKRKMDLMADINALKLGIKKDIAKSITDPRTLKIIEHAVITPYGHTFDQASITRWLEENNSCPITAKPLELKQLSPDFSLQKVIDDLSPKLKELKVDTDSTDTNQSA